MYSVYNVMYRQKADCQTGGRCGLDRMVVGFITTYAISAYQH